MDTLSLTIFTISRVTLNGTHNPQLSQRNQQGLLP